MTRVLLADDPPARAALRLLLRHQRGFELVGEAGDAAALLAGLATGADVVLLGWPLRGAGSAGRLVEAVRARPGRPRVVVLCSRPEDAAAAAAAGADEVVSKGDPPEQLLAALGARPGP